MESVSLLTECLLQRRQLLSAILDVTRQMEARSSQEEIWLEELLDKRQLYLERLQKCAGLICVQLSALPAEDRAIYMSAAQDDGPVHPDCPADTAALIQDCRKLRQRILASDQAARSLILARQADLRKKTVKFPKNPEITGNHRR